MNDEPIHVGIVGAGRNTRAKHIPGLRAFEHVEIVSVCNRSMASSKRVAEQFGIPKTYRHWRELVEATDTDAIVIGTWPYLHCPVTLAALESGKHVLCEARMAMNAREAHAMRDAARARPHLIAQVVPSPITLSVDATAQRLIAEGYLGDVLSLQVRAGGTFVDRQAPLHWRRDFDLSGYNVMSLGIWYEAVLRWVGEATGVMAMGQTFVKMRQDAASGRVREVRVPEHVEVIAAMACGAQAHFSISSVCGLSPANELLLYGSEGTLRFAGGVLYGGRRGDKALQEIPIPPEEGGGWRVEEEFVNAIQGKEPVTHTTFDDGVKYMEFTEAVARSMAEGRAIPLPL